MKGDVIQRVEEIYQKYSGIKWGYKGEQTDWQKVVEELDSLAEELKGIHFRRSQKSGFYYFIKESLLKEIETESSRVCKIWLKAEEHDEGGGYIEY